MEEDSPTTNLSAWRWLGLLLLFFLFPIPWHPWWLAIVFIAGFAGLVHLLIGT